MSKLEAMVEFLNGTDEFLFFNGTWVHIREINDTVAQAVKDGTVAEKPGDPYRWAIA